MGNAPSHSHQAQLDNNEGIIPQLNQPLDEDEQPLPLENQGHIQPDEAPEMVYEVPPPELDILPEPELFVEEPDDAGLMVHTSPVVKLPFAVNRASFKLQQKKTGISLEKEESVPVNRVDFRNPFTLEFIVDSEVDCFLRVVWGVEVKLQPRMYKSRYSGGEMTRTLPPGLNQVVVIGPEEMPKFSEGDAKFLVEGSQYRPLVIHIQNLACE